MRVCMFTVLVLPASVSSLSRFDLARYIVYCEDTDTKLNFDMVEVEVDLETPENIKLQPTPGRDDRHMSMEIEIHISMDTYR